MDVFVVVSCWGGASIGYREMIKCLKRLSTLQTFELYLAGYEQSTYQNHGLPSEVYNWRFQSPGWLTTLGIPTLNLRNSAVGREDLVEFC